MTIYMEMSNTERYLYHELPKVGDVKILVERENLNNGEKWYELRDDKGGGIPGNSDSSIRCYHGWRGTTNNIYLKALGLRRIEKIQTFKNGNIRLWLSDDLKPDAE